MAKCTIGTKKGYSRGYLYGEVLDKLTPCCDKFLSWFNGSGNFKKRTFNDKFSEEKNGFNLVSRGGEMILTIRGINGETPMSYCPFCGAQIEIVVTKVVTLEEKFKNVFDGFNEIERPKTP